MKRAYLANGNLVSPLFPDSYTAFVDVSLVAYLTTLLGTDYCYLVVNSEEIIKVMGTLAPNVLYIERFAEKRKLYLTDTPVQYFLTPNEVQDAIEAQTLSLEQEGAIDIVSNKISYPNIRLDAVGGIVVSALPKVFIQDIDTSQCCNDTTPAQIPVGYLKVRITDSGYRVNDDGSYRIYG